MLLIKFEILGKEWKMKILKNRRYKKKNGDDSVAITHYWKRQIDVPMMGIDLETITHELTHAYLTEMCHDTTALKAKDLEEVFAELMAKRGRELLDLADSLFAQATANTQATIHHVQKTKVKK